MKSNITLGQMNHNDSEQLFTTLLDTLKNNIEKVLTSDTKIKAYATSLDIKDLKPLANEITKKDILRHLQPISIQAKIELLEYIQRYELHDEFEKKEIPYIARFTMYTIVSDICNILERIFLDASSDKIGSAQLAIDESGINENNAALLLSLIRTNKKHYIDHFGTEYEAKLQFIEKVLKKI